eukprot:3729328-Rhodomonas_salina.1
MNSQQSHTTDIAVRKTHDTLRHGQLTKLDTPPQDARQFAINVQHETRPRPSRKFRAGVVGCVDEAVACLGCEVEHAC